MTDQEQTILRKAIAKAYEKERSKNFWIQIGFNMAGLFIGFLIAMGIIKLLNV